MAINKWQMTNEIVQMKKYKWKKPNMVINTWKMKNKNGKWQMKNDKWQMTMYKGQKYNIYKRQST